MAANPKFVALLQSLLKLTREGKLDWDESFTPDSYRIVKDYAIVEVSRMASLQAGMQFCARLEDKAGRGVEFLSSDDESGSSLSLLQDLYVAAERSAARGDELIDRMISDFSRIS